MCYILNFKVIKTQRFDARCIYYTPSKSKVIHFGKGCRMLTLSTIIRNFVGRQLEVGLNMIDET